MTDEEFDQIWKDCKERDARLNEDWNALLKEVKERRFLEFNSDPANERIDGVRMERDIGTEGKWILRS